MTYIDNEEIILPYLIRSEYIQKKDLYIFTPDRVKTTTNDLSLYAFWTKFVKSVSRTETCVRKAYVYYMLKLFRRIY